MQQSSKNNAKVIEIETGAEWTIKARTRGQDQPGADGGRPIQTWILVLANADGHRKFVPEARLWELFKKTEAGV